jgi:GTP pyrophosphokinase
VHRKDCINIQNVEDKRRLIEVSWGKVQQVYPVDIQIDAWDRVGLLRDITTIVADAKVNIAGISTVYHDDVISVFATLEIANMAELTHLLSRIQGVRGVISAARANNARANPGG